MKGLEVSLGRFFQDQLVQREVGNSSLESCIFQFEFLELPRLVDRKPAVLVAPPVVKPALSEAEWVCSVTAICLTAPATVCPLARAISTSRSLPRICSGLCRFLGISSPFSEPEFLTFTLDQLLGGTSLWQGLLQLHGACPGSAPGCVAFSASLPPFQNQSF